MGEPTTGATPPGRAAAAELLRDTFSDPRFGAESYLTWLYDDNPVGRAVEGTARGPAGEAVAHYALVPQCWATPAGVETCAISLNAVVREGQRRRGAFTEVAEMVYRSAAESGWRATITVANASSTPAFLNRLGFSLLGPLPVRLCLPFPSLRRFGGMQTAVVDERWLASDGPDQLAAAAASMPVRHRRQLWTAETLRWRLANPVARYAVHQSDDLSAISTRARFGPVPVAVLLKIFPRRAGARAAPAIAAACRVHRAPAAVYAGFNAYSHVHGVPLPRRVLPSPLNLVVRSFSADVPTDSIRVDTYEFLDADHY